MASEADDVQESERRRFLATMSHDIRTPLTALRGALGLLERKELPPQLVDQMVTMLRKSSDRLERLTLSLIAIDLIDDGSMSVLSEVADLRELAEDAATITRREHPRIELDSPDEPVVVGCDKERVVQALDHILDNARKFGGPEGTIRLSIRAEADRGVVRIEDEGPGIAPEHRESIFERYLQIGERLPNEPRGAGIGLYLARWNARALKGDVTVVDGDAGAAVELTLPLLTAPGE
jgi:signal transduction histidine kinase